MFVFSRILQVMGCCNFAIAVALTVYGYIFPSKIEGGTFINTMGFTFIIFGLFLMLLLIGVFYLKMGHDRADDLINFNVMNSMLYVIAGINLVYRLFFCNFSAMENGSSLTGAKLMAALATSILINLSVAIMTTNYLKESNL